MTKLANLLATLVVSVGIAPSGGAARAAGPEEETPTVAGAVSSNFPTRPWMVRAEGWMLEDPDREHRPERRGRRHGRAVRGGPPRARGDADGRP